LRGPRLVLGTAQLGLPYGIANRRGRLADVEVDAILRTAFDLGVHSLDLAPDYGDAEQRVGRFLAREGRPDALEICTKLSRLDADLAPGTAADAVRRGLDASLRRLGVETVDVYLIHSFEDLEAHGQLLVDALAETRAAGRARRIGASVYAPADARRALAHAGVDAVQYPFSIFDRRFQVCEGRWAGTARPGALLLARSLFLQGAASMRASTLPPPLAPLRAWAERLAVIAGRYAMQPVEVALRYAAARSGADGLVVGVESAEQLREICAWLVDPAPSALIQELDYFAVDLPESLVDPRRWA